MGSNVHHVIPDIDPGVLDDVRGHVRRHPDIEVGGILLGNRAGGRSRITASVEAHGAQGDITSLTFTHESWAAMLVEIDERHPDTEVLGWYHSHPGHGIFLSEHDRFIHRNFFPATWHVALVIDPQHDTEGLFAWTDTGLELVSGGDGAPEPVRAVRARPIEIDPEDLTPETPIPVGTPLHDAGDPPASAPDSRWHEDHAPGQDTGRAIGLLLPIAAGGILGLILGYIAGA